MNETLLLMLTLTPIAIVYQMFPLGFPSQVWIIRIEAWTSGER